MSRRKTKNVAIMVGLLLGTAGIARLVGVEATLAGRIGIVAVFALTAIGPWGKSDEIAATHPAWTPARPKIVVLSGWLELALAILVLVPAHVKIAGGALCIFLGLVSPVNVHAAIKRIDFGGHRAGPRYLWVRLPLQLLLLGWTYWFAVRLE